MTIGPVVEAIEAAEAKRGRTHRVLLTPSAPVFDQRAAERRVLLRILGFGEQPGRVRVEFLLCEAATDTPAPEAREGQEFRWADAADLAELRFLPANAGVLERLVADLSSAR